MNIAELIAVHPVGSLHPTPPFEQIRAGLRELIESGELAPGDRLPTVRQLALDLGVATNTVARAYRELEASGVVQTRGRAGTVVTGNQAEQLAKEAAVAYLRRTRDYGFTAAEAVAFVQHLVEHPVRSS